MRVGPLTVSLVAIATALAGAGAAHGAVVSETFDAYADSATIDDEVPGVRITGTGRVFTPPAGRTQSSPRAMRNPLSCPDTTCANGAYKLTMEFARPVREVSLRTGDVLVGCFEFDCPRARLAGYRADGSLAIASPSKPIPTGTFEQPGGFGGRITEPFAVNAGSYTITRAVLYVGKDDVHGEFFGSPRTAQIDNLVFDQLDPEQEPPPDPPPPAAPTVEITDPPSGATFATPDVRLSGQLTAAAGLTAFCFSVDQEAAPPTPCDLAPFVREDNTFQSLSVSGLHDGANRVTAWVTDGRGRTVSHTITINVAPRGFDLAGRALELVQTVQRYALPFSVATFEQGALRGFTGDYDDIEPDPALVVPSTSLVAGKRTLVRFFADAPGSGPVRGARAVLHGWVLSSTGVRSPLPGSPVSPLFSPAQVERTLDLPAQRVRNDAAFGFELPTSWTQTTGQLILAGEVNPDLPGDTGECAACRDNNVFALKNVNFQTTRPVTVLPVNLYYRQDGRTVQVTSADAARRFEGSRKMLPAALDVRPLAGGIEVTDIVTGDSEDQVRDMRDRLISWSEDRRLPRGKIMGLIDSGHGGLAGGRHGVTGALDRQLDFVAHEFFHTLGYPHAGRSPDCYSREGDKGESWPPDDRGVIRGMWVERSYESATRRNLFTPFGTPGPGFPMTGPAEWIDFESYCSAEPTTWIDPRFWERGVSGLARGGSINTSSVRAPLPDSASAAQAGSKLRVTASSDGAGAEIQRVEPSNAKLTSADPASSLRIVVRNAAGGVVSNTPVPVESLHLRPAPGEAPEPSFYVNAVVPGRGAAKVELVAGETVLASRERSRSAPRVALLSPRPGSRVRGGRLVVRWRARDADGDALLARVDFSANGGRTWSPLGVGLRGGSARLSTQFISRSKRARLRVIVNDGFHSATALSGRLTADGSPPVARILAPASRGRLNGDAPLNLSGRGYDDTGARLRGKRLTWRSGGLVIGRGEELTVQAGEVQGGRVALEVRDRHKRVSRARARVDVTQVKPFFVSATAAKPARRATALVLRVATTSPATLTVTGRGVTKTTARVGQDVSRVRVPIRLGQKSFTLALKLTAGSFVTEQTLAVARR